MLRDEVECLAQQHTAVIHYLVGSRHDVPLDSATLLRCAPNIRTSDVFLCGPEAIVEQAVASAKALGVRSSQIHAEAFAY